MANKKIILLVKEVDGNPDDVVSTYYENKAEFISKTKNDNVLKSFWIKRPNIDVMNRLENSDIDIESWIDELTQKNANEITAVVKRQLKKGYKIDDFELFQEEFKNSKYYVAFSNDGPGKKDYGSGDTEKYIVDSNSKDGLSEDVERDGCDIAEKGQLVDHKAVYKQELRKRSKSKTNNKSIKFSKTLKP